MSRPFRIAAIVTTVLVVGAALVVLILYLAVRHEPAVYRQLLQSPRSGQIEGGRQLEQRVLQLHNQMRRPGPWQLAVRQDQINGWLATDLPAKFPDALPAGAADPRVVLGDRTAQLAFRYCSKWISTVVSLTVSVQMSDQPNTVAVRLVRLKAGSLPLPAAQQWKEFARRLALRCGASLRWTQIDGQDAALLKLPDEPPQLEGRQLQLESIELRPGEVRLSGRST